MSGIENFNNLQGVKNIGLERALELDITYVCNMGCLQCNRALGVMPSKEAISVIQIKRLFEQLIEMPSPFVAIRILGGEPTLHPDLDHILNIVNNYRKQVQGCTVTLWTHGYGDLVKRRIQTLPNWLKIHISFKKPVFGGDNFEAFLAAPIEYEDVHDKTYSEGCKQIGPHKCGVGFSLYGIYACPVAGAIDRVLGLNIGIKDCLNISSKNFKNQCELLCRYCGHFLADKNINLPRDTISKTWNELIKNKKSNKELLTKY